MHFYLPLVWLLSFEPVKVKKTIQNTKPPQLHENKRQNLKKPALNMELVGVIDQILWGVIKQQHQLCSISAAARF